LITILAGNVTSSLQGATEENIYYLREHLRYENDVHQRRLTAIRIYGDAKKIGLVEQYHPMVSNKGVFLSGLVDDVIYLLEMKNIPYMLVDNRSSIELDEKYLFRQLKRMKIKPREYQLEGIFDCLEYGRGIVHAATGYGKSILISSLPVLYSAKTLIIVDRELLANQLRQELEDNIGGVKIGMIGSGVFDPQDITVGMVQSLSISRKGGKKKKILQDFMSSVELLIVDEAHHTQAASFQSVIKNCVGAAAKFGFTATPLTSKILNEKYEDGNKDIVLKAYLGPVIHSMGCQPLIDAGWLAKPTVYIVKNTVYNDYIRLSYNEEYDRIIMQDEERNKAICDLIAKQMKEGKRVIGFVRRIDHGEEIARRLDEEYGIDRKLFAFVNGTLESMHRADLLAKFKSKQLQCLFGTVLKEGLNFHCDVGINMAGGEAEIDAVQKLGRVLRKTYDPAIGDINPAIPEFVDYYDFEDAGHDWFSKHAAKRIATYKKEGHDIHYIELEDLCQ
jgi:superfamily II DNA or RNA helicase